MVPEQKSPLSDKSDVEQELQKTISQALEQAKNYHLAGNHLHAAEMYQAILDIDPNHPETNHNLGILLLQDEKNLESLSYFNTALTTDPSNESYWLSYLKALVLTNQIDTAKQTLAFGRNHGLKGEAVDEIEQLIVGKIALSKNTKIKIDNVSNFETPLKKSASTPANRISTKPSINPTPSRKEINKLNSLCRKGNVLAVEIFSRKLTVRFPDYGLGWKNLGLSLCFLKRYNDALRPLEKAVSLLPNDPKVHTMLGSVLDVLGRVQGVTQHFENALKINQDFIPALNALGCFLRAQGKYDESEGVLQRAIKVESSPELLNNLGATLIDKGRFVDAESLFRRAISKNPEFILGQHNLGIVLRKQGRLTEAIEHEKAALKLNPLNATSHTNVLFVLNFLTADSNVLMKEAQKYGDLIAQKVKAPFTAWKSRHYPKKLRVGLVSGDLYNHPVGYFLEDVLSNIDNTRIEFIAYPTTPKADDLTDRLKPSCVSWTLLCGKNDEDAAKLIHSDGIHILIDLAGHTSHNRLPLFAWKPAPIQVSWLGYFATTGVAEMDYFIADLMGVPKENQKHFMEDIWYLPDTRLCFSVPKVDIPVASLPALRNGYVTFGCFQTLPKVGDEVLRTWASVFRSIPTARLRWQCHSFTDSGIRNQVFDRMRSLKIDISRIELKCSTSREDYFAAHSEIDVILDSFPYPGGTTTCEALWMGVPTITLSGQSLLARQGASLLSAAGLPEFITNTKKEYVAQTLELTSNLKTLSKLRDGLRLKVINSKLFDAPRFAKNLEDALWGMWDKRSH